jgi:hypothetical protein
MTKRDKARAIHSGHALLGLSYEDCRRLLRVGATLNRLAEACCNGDYPADDGTGGWTCSRCERIWTCARRKLCPDCAAEDRARAIVEKYPNLRPRINGDPCGPVLEVVERRKPGDSDTFPPKCVMFG